MAKAISELMPENLSLKSSLQTVMENYKHIELDEDEMMEAIIWGKRRKDDKLKLLAQKEKEAQNRKILTAATTYDIVRSLMLYRSEKIFDSPFKIDENNSILFEVLCRYFGNDLQFHSLALSMGVENPSLEKGIFLAGSFGTGKTWMMRLFQQNQRQVYQVKNCKVIADEFMEFGEDKMNEYIEVKKNAVNDVSAFFQPNMGLCLDDIGTEDIKTHFGNKKNVIGDILEKKYDKKTTGVLLHGTTNLTADQLKEFYGNRVTSRMRQMFNFIELKGNDRRK